MGVFNSTGGEKIVVYANAFIRFVQLIIGATTIGYYANQTGFWLDHGIPSKTVSPGPKRSSPTWLMIS